MEKIDDPGSEIGSSSPKVNLQIINSLNENQKSNNSSVSQMDKAEEKPLDFSFVNRNQKVDQFVSPTFYLEKRADINGEHEPYV